MCATFTNTNNGSTIISNSTEMSRQNPFSLLILRGRGAGSPETPSSQISSFGSKQGFQKATAIPCAQICLPWTGPLGWGCTPTLFHSSWIVSFINNFIFVAKCLIYIYIYFVIIPMIVLKQEGNSFLPHTTKAVHTVVSTLYYFILNLTCEWGNMHLKMCFGNQCNQLTLRW